MNTNDIELSFNDTPQEWQALRPNQYDGAPDSHSPIGRGKTPIAALADLLEQEMEREAA